MELYDVLLARALGGGSGGGGDTDAEDGIVQRTISGSYANSRVTTIGSSAFQGCLALTDVDFPNVSQIYSDAFRGCSKLKTVNVPAVETIHSTAFYGCSSLEAIRLPKVTSIGHSAFRNCSSFKSIYILASSVPTLMSSGAFYGTKIHYSIGSIYVLSSLVSAFKTAAEWSKFSASIVAYVE